jgi:activator of HSP90 ATPase
MVDVRNLKQSVTIKASPVEVYDTLVDPERHAAFSGAEAEMDPKPGGVFTAYGGDLEGRVLELTRGRRIVLAWRSRGWPKGHYSIADFSFKKVAGGTRLEFAQYGIPVGDFADIRSGWKDYYWTPMKQYLEE